jgi:hypothetical protein
MAENRQKSSAAIVVFAWLLVRIPLGWGVHNTLLASMKLFQSPPAATVPVVPPKRIESSLCICACSAVVSATRG